MSESRICVRYSEAFKIQVINELESGKLGSIEEARRRYGIPGGETVQKWLKKYGRNDLRTKVIRVEKPEEQDQIKQLKKQIKQLKEALADTHVEGLLYKAHFEILCEETGLNPEEYKKKLATEALPRLSRTRQPVKRKK